MNKKMTTTKKVFLSAALISGVAIISQFGSFPSEDAELVKTKWNEDFSDFPSHHVEKMSGLPLFAVYTTDGVFFTDENMKEVINGRRMVPHNGSLMNLTPVVGNTTEDLDGSSIKTDSVLSTSKSLTENEELSSPLSTNRELVEKLKAEFAKAKEAQKNASSSARKTSGHDESGSSTETSKMSSVPKINPDDIREDKQFVYYSGSKINKIQYDQTGQVVSDDDRRSRIKNIFDSAVKQADGWTIPYVAENEKLKMLVFSDPTCPYCQRLHRDIDRLNKAGISVYYMLYPRALVRGSEDKSAQAVISMMNTFWCSDTPQETMDRIYNHEYVEPNDQCFAKEQGRTDLPVQEHFLLGRIFNLAATPLTVLSDGRLLYGYGGFSKFMDRVGEF